MAKTTPYRKQHVLLETVKNEASKIYEELNDMDKKYIEFATSKNNYDDIQDIWNDACDKVHNKMFQEKLYSSAEEALSYKEKYKLWIPYTNI